MISATSGITVRTTSVSSTRSASGRPPLARTSKPIRTGRPARRTSRTVRLRLSSPRRVTSMSATMTLIGGPGS